MNIDAEIKRLEEDLAALKAKAAAAKTKKWQPEMGCYGVRADGGVLECESTKEWRMAGSECQTREQAEALSKARKTFQWMCQLAFELNPSGKLGGNYGIYFSHCNNRFYATEYVEMYHSGRIFETWSAAEKAVEIMNASPDDWKFYK